MVQDNERTQDINRKTRLYKMIKKAKPEIFWQSEGIFQAWKRKRLENKLAKEIRSRLAYHWGNYEKLDQLQRQALDYYVFSQEHSINIEHILWDQGFRHGDHVLIYDPNNGSFKQRVLTFYDQEGLMVIITPQDLDKWEQSHHVKPENRTSFNTQPDLTSHETDSLVINE